MPTVSFNIPDAVATKLEAAAAAHGFPTAKAMVKGFFKDVLQETARKNAQSFILTTAEQLAREDAARIT